jgi:gamma-glutamylputrescine oxidase
VTVSFNDGLNMGGSYYAATANAAPEHPRLTEEIDVDLAVVGGGCTGLSAALHAAERGLSVAVLEGGKVGWGASGRNGGQVIPGLRKGALELTKAYGAERARALFVLALEARTLVCELIERHAIDCDLRLNGHLLAAVKDSDLHHIESEIDCLSRVMDYNEVYQLSAADMRAQVASDYRGGLLDPSGGHMHSLNYALGLARAAQAAGATIHEHSPAVGLTKGTINRVTTPEGAVRARLVLLAGDALLQGLEPEANKRIMPVANYVVATAPLPNAAELIPHDAAISDSRFVVNYYRLTPDGRVLFGGGERYTPEPPRDIAAFVRPHLEAVFPQLAGVAIDHAWGGLVSITRTRLPHLGRRGEVYFAHGYSGMGVVLSTLGGKLAVEAMLGGRERFELFAGVAPPAFPGGVALRTPLHVLGMLWFALRDRI